MNAGRLTNVPPYERWILQTCGRNPSLGNLIELGLELDRRGVAVRSLTEPIDTTSAMGRFQLQLLGALAELERGLIQERTRAGREAARARGRTGGRPPAVTKRTLAAALAMLERGELTMSEIAAELGGFRGDCSANAFIRRRATDRECDRADLTRPS